MAWTAAEHLASPQLLAYSPAFAKAWHELEAKLLKQQGGEGLGGGGVA
jgi:hypothetical protein